MSLDPEGVEALRAGVDRITAERGLASCQYALALEGEVVEAGGAGRTVPGARYLLFSSTKVVPVAAAWRLIGEGALDPSRPVTTWWPEFGRNGKDAITLEQVMTHSAGLTNAVLSPAAVSDRDRRVEEMSAWTPEWAPGSRSEYHAQSAHWVLAELIARAAGSDHRAAIRELVLDPLGLDRLELGVPRERQADIQPIEATGDPATVAELADEIGLELAEAISPLLSAVYEPDGPVLGPLTTPEAFEAGIPGAGGVSDATSLALLYQAFLHDSARLWDRQVLTRAYGEVLARDPGLVGNPAWRGLGVEIAGDGPDEDRSRRLGSGHTSARAFGHSGAGGQIAWADPVTGVSFVFLTNGWDRNMVAGRRRDREINRLATGCRPSG